MTSKKRITKERTLRNKSAGFSLFAFWNKFYLIAPGQRFAAHAQHVVVRKRDIAIQVVADDAISTDLTIGVVAVSIKRVLAVIARVRLVRQPGVVLRQLFVVGVIKAIAVNNLVAVELVRRNQPNSHIATS